MRGNAPTRIFAAGLSSWMDRRMVAPSLVTTMSFPAPCPDDWRILSWEFFMASIAIKNVSGDPSASHGLHVLFMRR